MNYSSLLALPLVLIVAIASAAGSDGRYPRGSAEITYRQKTDGKLSESFHVLNLACRDSWCEIITISLNQCMGMGDGASFYPRVERSTTRVPGSLRIVEFGDDFLLLEDDLGEAKLTYRFQFDKRILSAQGGGFLPINLIDFSGAVVKDSSALGEVISWQLEPLIGVRNLTPLSCPVMLPGLPRPPKKTRAKEPNLGP